jgi:hypothetical protein
LNFFGLQHEGFYDTIAAEWTVVSTGDSPIETWQKKSKTLEMFLRGWAKSLSGKYKKEKKVFVKHY